MERTSSWLISIFIVVFWVFRLIVAISTQTGNDFGGFVVFDFNKEVIILFVTVLSYTMIVKRNVLGALIYCITYGYYFGGYIYMNVLPAITNGTQLGINIIQNSLVSLVAILLAVFAVLDLFIEKIKKSK